MTYLERLHAQISVELYRCTQLLTGEIAAWQALSDTDENRYGIHKSQIREIKDMLANFNIEEQQLYPSLGNATDATSLARAASAIAAVQLKVQAVAAIFRHMLAQRTDLGMPVIAATGDSRPGAGEQSPQHPILRQYAVALDHADLISADCYTTWTERAVNRGLLKPDAVRVPPLTYFVAEAGPGVATRKISKLSSLGFPLVAAHRDLDLPVSVIALPFAFTLAFSSYCSIYHEVGHLLIHDLKLKERFLTPLAEALGTNKAGSVRARDWEDWRVEIVADAIGVLLGGAGFAYFMMDILFNTPAVFSQPGAHSKRHPIPYIRVFLIAALLRELQVEVGSFAEEADNLEARCRELYGEPQQLQAYLGDCQVVAQVLLNTPIRDQEDKEDKEDKEENPTRLRDFAPHLENDTYLADRLANFLVTGTDRPHPAQQGITFRHVPVATRLAIEKVTEHSEQTYKGIHETLLEYCRYIPRPSYLSHEEQAENRREFMRRLVHNFIFAAREDNDDVE
ncbi:MAG TPA: hypothetical protein VGE04_02890 [Chloroflexia bacterium]|jgi:hypothetical protein